MCRQCLTGLPCGERQYETTWPLVNGSLVSKSYDKPTAPFYITSGAAGPPDATDTRPAPPTVPLSVAHGLCRPHVRGQILLPLPLALSLLLAPAPALMRLLIPVAVAVALAARMLVLSLLAPYI